MRPAKALETFDRLAVPAIGLVVCIGTLVALLRHAWFQALALFALLAFIATYNRFLDAMFRSGYSAGVGRAAAAAEKIGMSGEDALLMYHMAMSARPSRRTHEKRVKAFLDELRLMERPTEEDMFDLWERHRVDDV